MTFYPEKFFSSLYAFFNRCHIFKYSGMQWGYAKAYFFYKKYYEDSLLFLTQHYPEIFKQGHILDIGANIGYTAVLFSTVISPGYQIFAFEPEKWNFALLNRIVEANKLTRIISPQRLAVSEKQGIAKLWINIQNQSDHRMITPQFSGDPGSEIQTVSTTTLDDFVDAVILKQFDSHTISFIKIDVQGVEWKICQGMARTLEKHPETILCMEYYPEGIKNMGDNPEDILSFFKDRHYRTYVLSRKKGLQAIEACPLEQALGLRGYVDLVFSKKELTR